MRDGYRHHVDSISHLEVSTIMLSSLHVHTLTISRAVDPIFAVSVGVAAAAVRINREEKEKGRTTQESYSALKRRFNMLFQSNKVAEMDAKKAT